MVGHVFLDVRQVTSVDHQKLSKIFGQRGPKVGFWKKYFLFPPPTPHQHAQTGVPVTSRTVTFFKNFAKVGQAG